MPSPEYSHLLHEAYVEGKIAHDKGELIKTNPYRGQSVLGNTIMEQFINEWDRGWCAGWCAGHNNRPTLTGKP